MVPVPAVMQLLAKRIGPSALKQALGAAFFGQ
jgi:hypothetical protein